MTKHTTITTEQAPEREKSDRRAQLDIPLNRLTVGTHTLDREIGVRISPIKLGDRAFNLQHRLEVQARVGMMAEDRGGQHEKCGDEC